MTRQTKAAEFCRERTKDEVDSKLWPNAQDRVVCISLIMYVQVFVSHY